MQGRHIVHFPQHYRRQMSRIGRHGIGRRSYRHQTSTCRKPRRSRQPCGARVESSAGKHRKVPTAVLMGAGIERRKQFPPQDRIIGGNRAGAPLDNPPGDADIEDLDIAAERPARNQQMAGLARHERHRMGGAEGGTQGDTPAPANPGRQVDGKNRDARSFHGSDYPMQRFRNGAGEPCSEDRIDDGVAGSRRQVRQWAGTDRALQERGLCLSPELLRITESEDLDHRSRRTQRAGSHVTVTAVVARSAEDDEAQGPRI